MLDWLNPQVIIQTLGLAGVLAVIFAESGLFFGFFLPGDSLLFTAGVLAAGDFFNIWFLALGSIAAAILGDSVGYAFGRRVGPKIFSRDDSRLFKKEYLARTQRFYAAHGRQTLILARFIPIVRTGAPILAGVGLMAYRRFLAYNVVGGVLWGAGLPLLGYFFGNLIPDPDRYLLPIILVIVFVSLIPVFRQARSRYTKE